MAKYEVIVREYNDDGHMTKESTNCTKDGTYDGVCLIGIREEEGKPCDVIVKNASIVDIAKIIADDANLIKSAIIAEAINRADKTSHEINSRSAMGTLFGLLTDR